MSEKYKYIDNENKYELAKHITDIYSQTILSENVRKGKIDTPSEFVQKYLECFEHIFEIIAKN